MPSSGWVSRRNPRDRRTETRSGPNTPEPNPGCVWIGQLAELPSRCAFRLLSCKINPGVRCRASECLNGTNSVRKMFKLNEFSRRCFRTPFEGTIQRPRVGRGGHPGQPDVRDGNAREAGTPGQSWGDFGGGLVSPGRGCGDGCVGFSQMTASEWTGRSSVTDQRPGDVICMSGMGP